MFENIHSYFIFKLITSILLGAFLGIRREMSTHSSRGKNFIGIRTIAVLCCLGTTSTYFKSIPYLPIIFFIGIFLLIAIAYAHGSFVEGKIGLTTELSALLTFWIGVLVGYGEPIIAIILTIFLAGIETFKDKIHIFVKGLNETEWKGALAFLTLSGAILPFLPHTAIDPWGILVPFSIWLIIMLISGISFIGYFLIKYLGAGIGVLLSSFFGSIVSSTAVTISLSNQSKKINKPKLFAIGIFIAITAMQLRVILTMFIIGHNIINYTFFITPMLMVLISMIIIFYYYKSNKEDKTTLIKKGGKIDLQDPFEILPALKFGLLLIVILLTIKFGKEFFGNLGVYAISMISGIIDADPIIISSLQSLKNGGLEFLVARNAIILTIITNTFVKMVYVYVLGSKELFIQTGMGITLIILSSLSALLI